MNAGRRDPLALRERAIAGPGEPWRDRFRGLGLALLCLVPCATAGAHEFSITPVTVVFSGDGTFRADIGLDADALALGLPLEADSGPVFSAMRRLYGEALAEAVETAREAVERDIDIRFNGQPATVAVVFPLHGTSAASVAPVPSVLGALARVTGSVPQGADLLTVRLPVRYKALSLTIAVPELAEPFSTAVQPGQASPPFSLRDGTVREGGDGVFRSYLTLGFTHILPKGLDHILFVLGLYLLSVHWRPLLYQVSAFTIAHSVTLGLSVQGVVSLPENVVEPLIALSIAWVAVENIATSELKPWRIAVVFGFGLLHGLGFAGVLGGLGMPEGRFLTALLSFNLGVEFGQLAVVAIAFCATARFRHLAAYRRWFVIPCCVVIAGTGLWWAVDRIGL